MMKRTWATALLVITLASAQPARAESFLCKLFGIGCPVKNPFLPVFEKATINNGFGRTDPLNEDYFADEATAQTVCQKFGCSMVLSLPCHSGGGPASCAPANERNLVFYGDSGQKIIINAGQIAKSWKYNDERLYPNVAQRLAEIALAARGVNVNYLAPSIPGKGIAAAKVRKQPKAKSK